MYVAVLAYAPMSLLLQVNVAPRWATSEPSPNWQALRPPAGAPREPAASIGCSGHTPVSMSATITLEPAVADPPSDGHTLVAPTKAVLSSSGCCSVSFCTAATPFVASSWAIWFAETEPETPP